MLWLLSPSTLAVAYALLVFWWRSLSRCVLSGLYARDVRHHGRFGPEGQLCAFLVVACTAPVAELNVVLFTVPSNYCTIAATATVVTSCSSSSVCGGCLRHDVVWWWICLSWWFSRFGLGQCEADDWKYTVNSFQYPRR